MKDKPPRKTQSEMEPRAFYESHIWFREAAALLGNASREQDRPQLIPVGHVLAAFATELLLKCLSLDMKGKIQQ